MEVGGKIFSLFEGLTGLSVANCTSSLSLWTEKLIVLELVEFEAVAELALEPALKPHKVLVTINTDSTGFDDGVHPGVMLAIGSCLRRVFSLITEVSGFSGATYSSATCSSAHTSSGILLLEVVPVWSLEPFLFERSPCG